MVDYVRKVGIWDLPDYDEIRTTIMFSIFDCIEDNDIINAIIIFGSYGRGEGTPGISDLDISIVVEETREDMVGYVSTRRAEEAIECSKDKLNVEKPLGSITRINDVDVRGDIPSQFDYTLKHLIERDDPKRAYILGKQEVSSIEEIKEYIDDSKRNDDIGFNVDPDDVNIDIEKISEKMVKQAEKTRRVEYFDEYIDVDNISNDDSMELINLIRNIGNDMFPDLETKIHRSGSGPHNPIYTGKDHLVGITVRS